MAKLKIFLILLGGIIGPFLFALSVSAIVGGGGSIGGTQFFTTTTENIGGKATTTNIYPPISYNESVGTTTSLYPEGYSRFTVYGTTTIQTAPNTANAFRILNAASTTVFQVDTINASTTIAGTLNVLSCNGCGSAITSLNGLTGATQTFTNDTNVTIVSGGTAHVITWAGTLADSRVADNVTLTNITQITNRAITDTMGTLTVARGGTSLTTFGGTNRILYTSTVDNLTSNANFVFDGTNLGVGTTTPGSIFSVNQVANFNALNSYIYSPTTIGNLVASTTFQIPKAGSPTINDTGQFAWDTTSGNLIAATSSTGHIVVGGASTTLYAFELASTSPEFFNGGRVHMPAYFLP